MKMCHVLELVAHPIWVHIIDVQIEHFAWLKLLLLRVSDFVTVIRLPLYHVTVIWPEVIYLKYNLNHLNLPNIVHVQDYI